MARTSGAIGMPTQTGTHTLVVGWSAKRKLFGFYGGISPCEVGFPPAIGWSLLARLSDGMRDKFECIGRRRSAWCTKAELSDRADSETPKEAPPCRLCITSDWMCTRGRSATA